MRRPRLRKGTKGAATGALTGKCQPFFIIFESPVLGSLEGSLNLATHHWNSDSRRLSTLPDKLACVSAAHGLEVERVADARVSEQPALYLQNRCQARGEYAHLDACSLALSHA
jgi:hypothetical protein